MPNYRFYHLHKSGQINGPGADHAFERDDLAFEHAATLSRGHAISVWEGERLLGTVSSAEESEAAEQPPRHVT